MNDFEGLLASDFGFKPQGKSAPMAGSKSTSPLEDHQRVLAPPPIPSKIAILSSPPPTHSRYPKILILDSVISSAPLAMPPPLVYDKPIYNDDIFDGVPRLKSSAANAKYEDVFTSVVASSLSKRSGSGIGSGSDAFDDLLGGFGNVDCSYNLSPEELCTKILLCD